jgi:hypothetical protein
MKNNSAVILFFNGLLAFSAPSVADMPRPIGKVSYGTCVKCRVGQKIEFPDFTVQYVGERRQSAQAYPRGFLYYDFKVRTANIEKVVSWSSGTGDIGPVEFEIGSKHYQLELRHSDKLGKLNDNELVIWPAKPPS